MLNDAKISRPRPGFWGEGRGQFLEVEAKAKDKVMNKKYQMMIDSIEVNLYHYDQNDTKWNGYWSEPWSGQSMQKESCKSTELKCWIITEMRWNKNEVSLSLPDTVQVQILWPGLCKNVSEAELTGPSVQHMWHIDCCVHYSSRHRKCFRPFPRNTDSNMYRCSSAGKGVPHNSYITVKW